MIEITVKVSDSERTLIQRFQEEDGFCLCPTDPVVMRCRDETIKNFNGKPDDVIFKTVASL